MISTFTVIAQRRSQNDIKELQQSLTKLRLKTNKHFPHDKALSVDIFRP